MTKRRALGFGITATLLTLAVGAIAPSMFAPLELKLYDHTLRASSSGVASDRVAIVAVDDASLTAVGGWPWPRNVLARLLDSLTAAGASVVAMDILLPETDRLDAAERARAAPGANINSNDDELENAVHRAHAVMGYAFTFDGTPGDFVSRCQLAPLQVVVVEQPGRASPLDQLFHPTNAVCSLAPFNLAARATGFLNASPDADGLMRRVPMIVSVNGQSYPSLALAALVQADSIHDVRLAVTPSGRPQLAFDGHAVPLDARGALLVRFRGTARTFPHISAHDVLNGRMSAGAVRGRVVFLGGTALGMGDLVATPFDIRYPGIEAHATIAANLMERTFADSPPWGISVALLAALIAGIAITVCVAWTNVLVGAGVGAVVVVSMWFASARAFTSLGVFVSPILPTLATVLPLLTLTASGLRYERKRAESGEQRRKQTHLFAVESLTMLTEIRDESTGKHVRRTREYAKLLAKRLQSVPRFSAYLTAENVESISQFAPLHDIGKVGVRDAVLRKPGPLTDAEYTEMKKHPELGYQILLRAEREAGLEGDGDRAALQVAEDLVRTHHERWNGSGYPRGLVGDEIPIPGRIMAVIDVYDALVQPRVYRREVSHAQAVVLLEEARGTEFDPEVVDAFLSAHEQFAEIATRLRDTDDDGQAKRATLLRQSTAMRRIAE